MAKSSKAVLWDNVEALMTQKFGQRNVTGFAKHVSVGVGTVQRIEAQATSVGLDILDKIADKFGLTAWQLLVPGLDVSNPPLLATQSVKMVEFVANIRKTNEAMTGALRAFGNTDPGELDEGQDGKK